MSRRSPSAVCTACLVAVLALAAWSVGPIARQATFRSAVKTVEVYATVHDKEGRLVPDLTKDDFRILDNGQPAEVTTFSNDVLPITVGLMLDTSMSMANEYSRVRASAMHFVAALSPDDRARIGTFSGRVAISPWLTGDKSILERILNEELWIGGGTHMWRALQTAMNSLASQAGRRVVLLVTDGAEACFAADARCVSFGEVKKQVLAGEFMVYGIGMEGHPLGGADLDALAEESGGGHFSLKHNADLAATFERVVEELHHQYALGFTASSLDGKAHKIEIKMSQPGLTARARKSYMAAEIK